MTQKSKSTKTCEHCGGQRFKSRSMTYPLKIADKQINIGRVAVKECQDCHEIFPTKAGQEKISRCLGTMIHLNFFSA